MLLVVELAAKSADAAEAAASVLDAYLETLLGKGLLAFRIGRNDADAARIVLLEEWGDAATHDALAGTPPFVALQRDLAPHLVEAPRAATYEIVAAGFADDDD
ncbi:MAG: hypothetical protein NVS2B8_12170 [Vulcanimicrobiaceae bacterium]